MVMLQGRFVMRIRCTKNTSPLYQHAVKFVVAWALFASSAASANIFDELKRVTDDVQRIGSGNNKSSSSTDYATGVIKSGDSNLPKSKRGKEVFFKGGSEKLVLGYQGKLGEMCEIFSHPLVQDLKNLSDPENALEVARTHAFANTWAANHIGNYYWGDTGHVGVSKASVKSYAKQLNKCVQRSRKGGLGTDHALRLLNAESSEFKTTRKCNGFTQHRNNACYQMTPIQFAALTKSGRSALKKYLDARLTVRNSNFPTSNELSELVIACSSGGTGNFQRKVSTHCLPKTQISLHTPIGDFSNEFIYALLTNTPVDREVFNPEETYFQLPDNFKLSIQADQGLSTQSLKSLRRDIHKTDALLRSQGKYFPLSWSTGDEPLVTSTVHFSEHHAYQVAKIEAEKEKQRLAKIQRKEAAKNDEKRRLAKRKADRKAAELAYKKREETLVSLRKVNDGYTYKAVVTCKHGENIQGLTACLNSLKIKKSTSSKVYNVTNYQLAGDEAYGELFVDLPKNFLIAAVNESDILTLQVEILDSNGESLGLEQAGHWQTAGIKN